MPTISVDLAYRDYRDIGVAILERDQNCIEVEFVAIPLRGDPEPERIADYLIQLCTTRNVQILLLDGPQGWKDPSNGLEHSRLCERALNTPAKTGLPGSVKPANYRPFVSFSISVFDQLAARGWPRLASSDSWKGPVAVESFPLSAWRSIGASALPSKARSRPSTLVEHSISLCRLYPLHFGREPNHDELQAAVSGLAGIAMESRDLSMLAFSGAAPFVLEGVVREGFIVNPRKAKATLNAGA